MLRVCNLALANGHKSAIEVRKSDLGRTPSPPNRACGSPAHGSPVGGFTFERTDRPKRGPRTCARPKLGKGCLLSSQLRGTASMNSFLPIARDRVICSRYLSDGLAREGTVISRLWLSKIHPPSCTPLLGWHYPASKLVWVL